MLIYPKRQLKSKFVLIKTLKLHYSLSTTFNSTKKLTCGIVSFVWQDYIETLQKLPKAKLLDLFQRRYLRSVIVNTPLSLSSWYVFPINSPISHCLVLLDDQIGVGLMVFQQFGGINGIVFYVSSIFESAGKRDLKFSHFLTRTNKAHYMKSWFC